MPGDLLFQEAMAMLHSPLIVWNMWAKLSIISLMNHSDTYKVTLVAPPNGHLMASFDRGLSFQSCSSIHDMTRDEGCNLTGAEPHADHSREGQ